MINKLTERQREIYNAICVEGITKRKDLMNFFHISRGTIIAHLNAIYEIFNVHSVADLIYMHYQNKINNIIREMRK